MEESLGLGTPRRSQRHFQTHAYASCCTRKLNRKVGGLFLNQESMKVCNEGPGTDAVRCQDIEVAAHAIPARRQLTSLSYDRTFGVLNRGGIAGPMGAVQVVEGVDSFGPVGGEDAVCGQVHLDYSAAEG